MTRSTVEGISYECLRLSTVSVYASTYLYAYILYVSSAYTSIYVPIYLISINIQNNQPRTRERHLSIQHVSHTREQTKHNTTRITEVTCRGGLSCIKRSASASDIGTAACGFPATILYLNIENKGNEKKNGICLLYTSPSPRD